MKSINKTQALLSFIATIVFLLIVYFLNGVLPFGEKTLLAWDLKWQYIDFFSWYQNAIKGEINFWYSLGGGFGNNTIGTVAYYLGSPLNILTVFFDKVHLPIAILVLTLVKTGLMSMSMQIYLNSINNSVLSIPVSIFYAMCSYSICFQFNIMWMDALVLLPILVLGVERLLRNEEPVLYTVALFLSIVTNYYMGYILSLFILIYAIEYIVILNRDEAKIKRNLLWNFAKYSVIAGGMSALVTIPVLYTLTLAGGDRVVSINELLSQTIIFNPVLMLGYLFAGSFTKYQGVTGGIPLLYCGVIALFGGCLFFTSRKIGKRIKIFYIILFLIIVYSFSFEGAYLIWHVGSTPSGSPWRFAFLWAFLLITIAYRSYRAFTDKKAIIISIIVTIIYFAFLTFILNYGKKTILLNVFFIAAWMMAIFLVVRRGNNLFFSRIIYILLTCIAGVELIFNSYRILSNQFSCDTNSKLDGNYWAYPEYCDRYENVSELVKLEKTTSDGYRTILVDAPENNMYNYGYMHGISSLDMYSSTEAVGNNEIFYNFGMGKTTWHPHYDDANATELFRSIAGVRYIIDRELRKEYDVVGHYKEFTLYENPSALPLGFIVKPSAISIKEAANNLVYFQNSIYRSLCYSDDKDVYNKIDISEDSRGLADADHVNVDSGRITRVKDYYSDGTALFTEDTDAISSVISELSKDTIEIDASNASHIIGKFNNTMENGYACFTIPYEDAWHGYVDGEKVSIKKGMGNFILVPLTKGIHIVELKYNPPFRFLGMLVSLICLVTFVYDVKKKKDIYHW